MKTWLVLLALLVSVLPWDSGSAQTPRLLAPGKYQWMPRAAGRELPSWPGPLAPGIYQTAPYAGIVVVPGPHSDDRAVIQPQERVSKMPVIKPPLEFVPRLLNPKP